MEKETAKKKTNGTEIHAEKQTRVPTNMARQINVVILASMHFDMAHGEEVVERLVVGQ